MDQSRSYWIQKDRSCLNSHVLSSFGDSWEEQAFAEDAAGPLGGCIWPPRSYTCSFCRREFRSAQALGGHMNVHRRDRARLKQISSPKSNQLLEPNSSLSRCVLQNPNEICNPNRNFDLDQNLFSTSSPRLSTDSTLTPFTCSYTQEDKKGSTTPVLSWSMFESRKRFHLDDLESSSTTSRKSNHRIEVNFTGNLNSVVRKRCETPMYDDKDDPDEDGLFSKRRRKDDDFQSFFEKNSKKMVNGDEGKSLVPVERSPNSTLENLDLELRLGDRP